MHCIFEVWCQCTAIITLSTCSKNTSLDAPLGGITLCLTGLAQIFGPCVIINQEVIIYSKKGFTLISAYIHHYMFQYQNITFLLLVHLHDRWSAFIWVFISFMTTVSLILPYTWLYHVRELLPMTVNTSKSTFSFSQTIYMNSTKMCKVYNNFLPSQ